MPNRSNNGSQSEDHHRAAELHDAASHAHLSAAQAHEKQDQLTGQQRSRMALEHSQLAQAYSHSAPEDGFTAHGVKQFGHEEISALAHERWLARGCPEGSAQEDWFEAARELRHRAESI